MATLSKGTGAVREPGLSIPNGYKQFKEVFNNAKAVELLDLNSPTHAIKLEPGEIVPWGPLYVLAKKEIDALREYLEDKMQRGWIRRSTSPTRALILFVPKKDRGLRLCINYRALNKVTIKNRTLLLLISKTLDRLSRAVRFTKLDLKDTYNRI
jgi:hypothetical protein